MYKTKSEFSVDYSELMKEVLEKPSTVATCYSLFHNYSVNNQFLAYWQLKANNIPISPINCLSGWNKLGRSVKKGQRAIYLWMPLGQSVRKVTDENGEEKIVSYFTRFGFKKRWFALSQTEGDKFEPEKATLKDFDFSKVYDAFGITLVEFDKLNGNIQGYANTKERTLAINPIAQEPEMTILHEVAHIVLNHSEVDYGTDLKELEAECTAYIIGSILGLPEEQLSHSRNYIQGWFKKDYIPEANAKNIMRASEKILNVGYNKVRK